jgi:predicted O-methyltransferase YrrM
MPTPGLEARLQAAFASPEFEARCRVAAETPGGMTSSFEQAALIEIVHQLAPAAVVEIGTAFAHTTRMLAQAVVDTGGGSVATVDPFGAERAPRIIGGWPEDLQAVTTYHCKSSMDFFLDVEVRGAPSGRDAPFDLVFVDGHHSFEYAFFDIMRAATFLKPGGVIAVDNIDQAGPAGAVEAFLSYFRRWTPFRLKGHEHAYPEFMAGGAAAILLAPPGLEIGIAPIKIDIRNLEACQISALRFPLLASAPGRLTVSANLYSRAARYDETGEGTTACVRNTVVETQGGEGFAMASFDYPAIIERADPEAEVRVQIELAFTPSGDQHLLLDVDQPVDVVA